MIQIKNWVRTRQTKKPLEFTDTEDLKRILGEETHLYGVDKNTVRVDIL